MCFSSTSTVSTPPSSRSPALLCADVKEYNICFTTIKRQDLQEGVLAEVIAAICTSLQLPDSALERGILPRVIETLIAKRRAVKELIKTEKSPEKLAEYDIRQKVGPVFPHFALASLHCLVPC
jgi:hypothetical protein